MSNLARKLIEAIQNSLLGVLFVRLWPILLIAQCADFENGAPGHFAYVAGAWLCIVALIFLTWALGFLAIHEIPKGRLALERVHDAPRNGFETWSTPPIGGLKPPRLTRAIVMALGQTSSRKTAWRDWFASACLFAALALFLLGQFDQGLLGSISPYFAGSSARVVVLWGVLIVMVAYILRTWAIDCRKRLEADADVDPPIHGALQAQSGGTIPVPPS